MTTVAVRRNRMGSGSRSATFLLVILLVTGGALVAVGPAGAEDRAAGDWTQASSGLPTSGTYFGVAFGDVNNDGKLDVVGATDGDGVRVFLGDGAGQWTAVATHPTTDGGFGDVTLGDIDDDGNLDIVAGSPGNGDGQPRGIHMWKGNGKGAFTEATTGSGLPTTGYWRGVDVGDVDGDGHLDVAGTNGYGTSEGTHVYLGDGTGKFEDQSTGLPGNQDRDSNAVLADFDGDGDLDVAVGGGAGVDVYLVAEGPSGDLAWTQSSTGLPSDRFSGISGADWNKDGYIDLVLSAYNAGGGVGVRAYGNGGNARSWTSSSSGLPGDGDYIENAVGDLDGDGNPDIVTAGSYGGEYGIHVYYGDGAGKWGESSPGFSDNVQYVGVDLGDYNGDGTLDILAGKRTRGGGIEVWRNPSSSAPPPLPEVEITFPAGGESLSGGATHEVTWNLASGTPAYSLTLEYSIDGGINYAQTISTDLTQADAGPGGTDWTLPVIDSANVRVRARVSDAADQTLTQSGLDFEVDSTPPTVSSTFPRNGATGVSTSTMAVVTFSEGMATSSSTAVTIDGPGSPILQDASWSGTQLTLATGGLEADSQYTVTVASGAMDDSLPGNAMGSASSFSFNTGSGEAPSPPIVTSTSPFHDDTDVAIGTTVDITFSKAMDPGATQSALSIEPGVEWTPAWSGGNTLLTVHPGSSLAPNTRYTVVVADSALASDGTRMDSPYTFHFTTGDPPDVAPPAVLDSYPPDRQVDVSPYLEEVTITFSEPMDTASVEAALSVSPGTVSQRTWRVGDTVLALVVEMGDGQRYTVTVGAGARDKAGNALGEGYTFYFVTREFEEQTNESGGPLAPMLVLCLIAVGAAMVARRRR